MGETSGWRHVAYLHDPPAGAATVELLLRNWQPASRVYFADLMLLELDRPGTEQRVSP